MKTFTTFVAMATIANAHMIMRTPQPAGSPSSSPLGSMAEYPCKGIASVADGPDNQMVVGQPNTLSFTGGATHGGGSCQVSIARGTDVTKDMKFMVIHSIEGGCPADADGNLSANPDGTNAGQFQFTIPDHPDIPAGEDYTLAWTWNNKIGNREFYMNCAKVTLQGSAKKRYAPTDFAISKRQQAPLPDVFVANLGNGCSTAEGIDVQYPNPGASLEVGSKAKLAPPTGNCGSVGNANPPAGNKPSASASAAISASASSNSVAPVAPSTTGNPGNPENQGRPSGRITQSEGGNFATASSPAAEATSAAVSQATSAVPIASSVIATSAASVPASPNPTGTVSNPVPVSGAQSGPCTEEGAWACAADGKSFQRCASGAWSLTMPMSQGMSCVPGVSANFAYNVSGGAAKRDMRSHIARRRHNLPQLT